MTTTPTPVQALADECKRLAKQMMRDSWATGDDSAWRPAYEQLCASLSQFTALAAPQAQPQAAAGLTLHDAITEASARYGSMRKLAEAIGVDVGYLSRLASGEKTEPSAGTLASLGLKRVVTYRSAASLSAQPAAPEQPAQGEQP